MKKLILFFLSIALFCGKIHSQNADRQEQTPIVYTVLINSVPDGFRFPLIGFLNVAHGNHSSAQVGFINTTFGEFRSAQIGFVNTTLGEFDGAQIGFVNTTLGEFDGAQIGFVNAGRQNVDGAQIGFVNAGWQDVDGAQIGFLNVAANEMEGAQVGFINIASNGIRGSQIGFLNIADTVSGGIPIGFLSIVRRGGYRAVEISVNEFYPVNVAFRIGVPRFYSFFQGGFNPNFDRSFAVGGGFGSLLPMGEQFYFNPEISTMNPITGNRNNHQSWLTLALNFRYKLWNNLQIAAGPTVTWQNGSQNGTLYEPMVNNVVHEFNSNNRLLVGARVALSVDF